VRNYRPIANSSRDTLDRLLFEMIKLFAVIIFICGGGIVLASERELGHPPFRTLTAHDYVEGLGQISSITEDPQGRILFGCEDAILVFDNNHWYRRVKVYVRSLGVNSRVIVNGGRLYFTSDSGLLTWDNGDMSQQPSATDAMTKFSATIVHGKICASDRNGSIYEPDGGRIRKIAESSSTDAGKVLAIVHRSIGEARRLAFIIEPPWHRPLWIEIVSGILAMLTVSLFIRWRTWQMTLRQRQLVQMVDLRTRELQLNEIELRKAKDAAELERERAETANRAKTAFLADISHELRTPLNSILGYAQILLRRREPSDDVGAKLQTILDSGEHLLEMTNEVLDLSRIESKKACVAIRSLELPKFIAGIVDEFQIRAADRRLRFIHEIQGEPPQWIETDPLRLRKVLYNLLGNAVKFTSQGEIAFRVYVTSERLRFEVKDTGKGIPQEDLPSIFKPFYQSSNNQLIGQGVGLGLHISKQLVEFLGGEIRIETELGYGSTFSFEIPRRNADPVSLAAPSPLIRNYEGQRRKILVVDDEPLNRSMLREFLSTVGLEATEADSPEKAFSLIKNGFDVVISDIRMPGYDGHTFCRNLRSSAETKDLIIIACSASVFADDQRLALDSGFSDFLAKPVMEEELFGVLGRHLKLRWTYKEARE
jgi:signal transduction histidine kinase/CheY-like chemotaxis protein